jgi:hypothetical protein
VPFVDWRCPVLCERFVQQLSNSMKESKSKRGANGDCLNLGLSGEIKKLWCSLGIPKIAKAILEWMVLCNLKKKL